MQLTRLFINLAIIAGCGFSVLASPVIEKRGPNSVGTGATSAVNPIIPSSTSTSTSVCTSGKPTATAGPVSVTSSAVGATSSSTTAAPGLNGILGTTVDVVQSLSASILESASIQGGAVSSVVGLVQQLVNTLTGTQANVVALGAVSETNNVDLSATVGDLVSIIKAVLDVASSDLVSTTSDLPGLISDLDAALSSVLTSADEAVSDVGVLNLVDSALAGDGTTPTSLANAGLKLCAQLMA